MPEIPEKCRNCKALPLCLLLAVIETAKQEAAMRKAEWPANIAEAVTRN